MSTKRPPAAYGADARRPVSATRPPRTEGAGSVYVPKPMAEVKRLSQSQSQSQSQPMAKAKAQTQTEAQSQPKAEAQSQSQTRVTGADIR